MGELIGKAFEGIFEGFLFLLLTVAAICIGIGVLIGYFIF